MAAVLGGIQSVTVSDSVAAQEETWTSVLAIQGGVTYASRLSPEVPLAGIPAPSNFVTEPTLENTTSTSLRSFVSRNTGLPLVLFSTDATTAADVKAFALSGWKSDWVVIVADEKALDALMKTFGAAMRADHVVALEDLNLPTPYNAKVPKPLVGLRDMYKAVQSHQEKRQETYKDRWPEFEAGFSAFMALKRAFLESGGRRPGGFQEELSEVLPDAASAASLNDIARNIPDEEETTEEEEDEFPAVKNPQDEWFKDVRMWVQLPRRSYAEDIDDIVRPLDLDNSNRAALPGQLHRISRIQDLGEEESSGDPISSGVTIRVERVVDGLAQYLQDLLARNESLLIFGVPGVGKTTLLRDLIHLKSEMVVQPYIMMVIDGSAEIGRADVTHPYLGAKTRRILADYQDQASAMMDDIRNRPHTAISDAIQNSKMAAVLGGIQSVTVSDSVAVQEETWTSVLAIQKVRLERRQRCPFRMAVKVLSKAEWLIYHELEEAVDNALQGVPVKVERRWINHDSGILMARWEDPIA